MNHQIWTLLPCHSRLNASHNSHMKNWRNTLSGLASTQKSEADAKKGQDQKGGELMLRRAQIAVILLVSILIAACSPGKKQNQEVHYMLTAKATYGGKAVEGSAVYARKIALGRAGAPRGEAIVIELGKNRRVYMIILDRRYKNYHGGIMNASWEPIFNPSNRKISFESYAGSIRGLPVGTERKYDYHKASRPHLEMEGYPMLVAFRDESKPESVFFVDTEEPQILFKRKFKFEEISIKKVSNDTPVTNEILNYLPWLKPGHDLWVQRAKDGAFGASLQGKYGTGKGEKTTTFAQKLDRSDFLRLN